MVLKEKLHYQIYKDTHVLLREPVEEVSWVAGQNLVIVECRDGLDALLQLLQTRFHTLHLGRHGHDNISYLSSWKLSFTETPIPFMKFNVRVHPDPMIKCVLLSVMLQDLISYLPSIQIVCNL